MARKKAQGDMEGWNFPDELPDIKKQIMIDYNDDFIFGYYDENEWYEYGGKKLNKQLITRWKYEE